MHSQCQKEEADLTAEDSSTMKHDATAVALKMEEGATSQGKQLQKQENQGMDSLPDPAEVMWPGCQLEFGSAKLISNFWPLERLQNKRVVF